MQFPQRHRNLAATLLCRIAFTGFAVTGFALPAFAQNAPQPEPPGLLNEIGKLLKSPADLLPSFAKPDGAPPADVVQPSPPPIAAKTASPATTTALPPSTPPAAAASPAPPAPEPPATAATRIFPGMVNGREVCPSSANGAPDCQAGTDKLCQSKGYKSGKSLNTDSAFSCSPRQARADGRKPCGTEHFVTSAFCQ